MKNSKLLWFVIVIGILAGILLWNGNKPEGSEPLPEESHESARNVPKAFEAPAPSGSGPASVTGPVPTAESEVVTPATDAADSMQQESEGVPSDEVASKIKQNLAGARKILQQKAVIEKSKSEDVHHMPKVTLDAARRLGEIAELEAEHPEQAESFREFYLECARDESTMTVTRAQCLDRYIKAMKLDAAAQKQFLAEFPEEIVRLVEALQ